MLRSRDRASGREPDSGGRLVGSRGSPRSVSRERSEEASPAGGGGRRSRRRAVLGRGRAQSIFKFIDAVGSGDAGSALRQLGRLLEEGEPPLRILALLDRLVGQLRIATEAQASGRRGGNLASLLGAPPSAARAIAENARRLDPRFPRRAVDALAEADRLLKSTRLPHRVVLEGLVLTLARRPKRYPEATRRASRDL